MTRERGKGYQNDEMDAAKAISNAGRPLPWSGSKTASVPTPKPRPKSTMGSSYTKATPAPSTPQVAQDDTPPTSSYGRDYMVSSVARGGRARAKMFVRGR